MKKYISTTLPYANSAPHAGHAMEFVIADIVAEFYRYKNGKDSVFLNVGVDEHGQKIFQQAELAGIDPKEYCDRMAISWEAFCIALGIGYDKFYRTTTPSHRFKVKKFYNDIKPFTERKTYQGNYCVGCEAFITDKDAVRVHGSLMCPIHDAPLTPRTETNVFFNLSDFAPSIQNRLVDKSISAELENLLAEKFDLSITRQNVKWGIPTGDGEDVFYVWFEALMGYVFSIGYPEDPERFAEFWDNSVIICGKDNLKFQAYILQALLLANNLPQTKEILVHGMILDSKGKKMSKSLGNVIDPIEQIRRYGSDAVRYYLAFGLNTFGDSKYSEEDLIKLWNSDIVSGLGNLIARVSHLIDLRDVKIDPTTVNATAWVRIKNNQDKLDSAFARYDFKDVRYTLNGIVSFLNRRINDEKPFAADCQNYVEILNEVFQELINIIWYYEFILKKHGNQLRTAFAGSKKNIIFKKLD